MEKICCVCKLKKDLDMFYNDKNTKDGKKYECKQCCKRYKSHWKTKEERNIYLKNKRKTNPTVFRVNSKRYWDKLDPALKVWRQARGRAKRNNIEFDIKVEDIIVPDNCPLLEIPLVKGIKKDYMSTHSIDRIDNTKGYIKGNIQILSMKANNMKSSANTEELLIFAKNIILQNKDHKIVEELLIHLKN